MQRTRSRSGRAGAHGTSTVVLAALVALALVAAGCSGSTDEADTTTAEATEVAANELEPDDPPQAGGALVFAVPAETDGWNPQANQWADAGSFIGSTFLEPLTTFDAEGVPQPFLAESVTPVDGTDFQEWEVTLKDGITFHDGSPLTPEAVAGSLTFAYSDPRSLTSTVLGELFESAEATGPLTTTVRFTSPWSAFPSSVAGAPGLIMAPAMLEAEDLGSTDPVGTGPFEFQSWERGRSLKVVRYPGYWQEGLPYLDEIEFQVVEDGKTRKTELETGNADVLLTNRGADIDDLEDQGFTVVRDYTTEQTTVLLSTSQGPFANVHARLALAHATDRESLVAQLGATGIERSDSPLLAGSLFEMDDADAGYPGYDPAKAAEELALYTEQTGAPQLAFTFSGLANLEDQQIMQILQEQWRQVGIETSIDTVEQTAYIGNLVTGTFEAAYYRGYAYPDPDALWAFWSSSTANGPGSISINFTQWSSPEVDAQLEAARATQDVATRADAFHEAVALRNAAAPELWLFSSPTALVASERVRGLNGFREIPFATFNPKPHLAEVWLER